MLFWCDDAWKINDWYLITKLFIVIATNLFCFLCLNQLLNLYQLIGGNGSFKYESILLEIWVEKYPISQIINI